MRLLVFFLLFFVTPAHAQVEWAKFEYFDNVGGLNDADSPVRIADNEAADLKNVVFTTSGAIKTRDGYSRVNPTSLGSTTATIGLFFYRTVAGTRYLVGVFDDDTIRKMDYNVGGGPDGTWDSITGSLVFSAGADNIANFAVGEDTLIIEDGIGTTAPYSWAGTGNAAALGGSPPNATMVAYHKRHAFAAGNSSSPSTLYFSDLGDIANWTTGLSGNVSIETNDGCTIRAIKPGFDALYIWKGGETCGSIWRLSGDDKDTFELQRMIQGIGTLSPDSVDNIGNDFIFTDGNGDTYLYDGGIKLRLVSSKIQGTLDAANFNRFQYLRSTVFDKDYYYSLSTAANSTHNRVMVFDTVNLAWTKFTGMSANSLAVAKDDVGEDMLVFGDYAGFVNNYPDTSADAGGAIDFQYLTKQFHWPELPINKTFRVLNVFSQQQGNYNLDVEVRADFESSGSTQSVNLLGSSSLWDTAVYDVDRWGGENLIVGRIEYDKEGQFFQINFTNDNLSEPVQIDGFMPYIEPSDRI